MPLKFVTLFVGCLFVAALFMQSFGLPPLVGFLVAGFSLPSLYRLFFVDYLSSHPGTHEIIRGLLNTLSEHGVLLLLFTIGLKLDLKALRKKECLAITLLQSTLMVVSGVMLLSLASLANIPLFCDLNHTQQAILTFALSFSSTVLVIKNLQDRGELYSLAGRTATSILVLQDILAIGYLSVSEGHMPSPWALLLLPGALIARPWFHFFLNRLGHNEMLVLGGVFFTLVPGAALFQSLGLDKELGALACGCLLAGQERSAELSKILSPVKELLLTCYFVQLGLDGFPNQQQVFLAVGLQGLLLLKGCALFGLSRWLGFRLRTSLLCAFYLTNFSEFGLIVTSVASSIGVISKAWLPVLSLATAFSFLLVKPMEKGLPALLRFLTRFFRDEENEKLNPEDRFINLGDARILILGMGRVGTGAYEELVMRYGELVLGIELVTEKSEVQVFSGRRVITADATDPDFWNRLISDGPTLELVLLTMCNLQTNMAALENLRHNQFNGRVAAIVEHEDERLVLREKGTDAVFNIYREAGSGFALHLIDVLNLDASLPVRKKHLVLELPEETSPRDSFQEVPSFQG